MKKMEPNDFSGSGYPVSVRKTGPVTKRHEDTHLSLKDDIRDYLELVVVTGGTGVYSIDGKDFAIETGDVFLIRKNQDASFKKKEGLSFYSVIYQPEKLPFPLNELKNIPGYHAMFQIAPASGKKGKDNNLLHLDRTDTSKVESILKHMIDEIGNKAAGYEAALFTYLCQLIIFVSRKYSETPKTPEGKSILRIAEIIGKMEKDYSTQWNISDLSKIVGMSEGNFSRIFQEATGKSPADYLIDIRIKRAMTFLSDLSLSITDISYKVGFTDSNYFTRMFRKIVGVNPAKYRKQLSSPSTGF